MNDFLIVGGRVIDPANGVDGVRTIVVQDGVVAEVGTGLTRAVMTVKLPVRSVLAEPVVKLSTLMTLQPGDVIPIHFGAEVPVMVGGDRLGTGAVGTSTTCSPAPRAVAGG